MALRLSINIGFITNSSSMVYHFPRELFQDKRIQAVLKAFELDGGFVGSDLWHRGLCATVAMTKEQRIAAKQQLVEAEYGSGTPYIDTEDDDSVVVIYGDEHRSIAYILSDMLKTVAEEKGISVGGQDYN